ncbi:glutamate--cysteine ligase [Geopsychrobacter electrodiphilus]|uniref:glutamate--cysteine ligase n=1 Tax=Geopsychrobacter electrodiphilus TaxID=225196 RepID=UPI0003680EAE|nr:glutamate-cysteine ligase family protein [Geopsychrobacter electrodiphilus]
MRNFAANQLISSRDDLLAYLRSGARPREDWGIGLETEKLVIDAGTGEAASYGQIRELLTQLDGTAGWQGIYDDEALIGLQGKRSSVTLEPGGQLELSGRLCCDMHCNKRDLARYTAQINEVAPRLGLAILGFGIQPFTPLPQIEWLPKKRYAIMGPYMLKTGDMGQRMMKQTAGTQVNLDYLDEADCVRKLRLLQWLAPVFYALFANSPLLDGVECGYLSVRGEIWSRTDNDRCGLIPAFMEKGGSLDDYVAYALQTPLYFLQRGARLVDMTDRRISFADFLEQGAKGEVACLGDWDVHLSTLFPEVRLRPQLELRTPDSLPPDFALAVASLVKGLFYDDLALQHAEALIEDLNLTRRQELYRESWRIGLKARFGEATLLELARELVALARQGLARQYLQGYNADDESCFLDPLEPILRSGETLAELVLAGWHGSRQQKLKHLQHFCGYAFKA